MSGISSASSVNSLALSTDKISVKAKESVQNHEKGVEISKDKLSTSNVNKSPVWEGVKLQAGKGAIYGGATGAVAAGGITWGAGKIIQVFNNEHAIFGTFGGKGVLIAAAVGLVGGLAIGASTGAVQGAVAGKVVEVAKKNSANNGTDASKEVRKKGAEIGAVAGVAFGLKSSLELTAPISNPALKAGAVVGLLALSAAASGAAGAKIASSIYNKSN